MGASISGLIKKSLGVAGIAAGALGLLSAVGSAEPPLASAPPQRAAPPASSLSHAARLAEPAPPTRRELLQGFDPRVHEADGPRRVSPLEGGRRAILSLEPGLQSHVEGVFRRYEVPFGAVVAMEPATGRVLAYVSHSSANPDAGDLVLDATPPAASVFKVITGSALVDAGVGRSRRVCYGGGSSRLREVDLEDNPRRDNRCATLGEAMGGSINSVFAKLADRHLDPPTLERYAAAFGFGHALPFDVPTRPSPAEVPTERLEFARTAAGFWHMHMSPLHAALIGATIANGGEMPRASIVDRVEGADGGVLYENEPSIFRPVIPGSTAGTVRRMMERTVSHGTARRTFFDAHGNAFLPGISVAGKTGTLSSERPYRGYTWWVGFAPADAPTVAVAALVVNTPQWRIKAAYMARETLRYHLVERPRHEAAEARRAAADLPPAAADEASPAR